MAVPIEDGRALNPRLETVAVSCELNTFGGLHVAFLYMRDDDSIWQCDLAWETCGRNFQVQSTTKTCWVNINLPQQNLDIISAQLERLDETRLKRLSIPYDVRFNPGKQYIDASTWSYTTTEPGLTCATFIIAVLKSLSFDLFLDQQWPSRPEDAADLELLIENLERCGLPPTRIAAMRENHNNVRYRPEEICGSVSICPWPVAFAAAEKQGALVKAHVLGR